MKNKVKICKKHNWQIGESVCPVCGVKINLTESGDNFNFEMSLSIDIPVCAPIKRKSGIVTFKTYEQ